MALAHAILALLIESPRSGYELTKVFAGSVGCFWKATHQQIYRELAKLENQGWLSAEVVMQESRPDKKLYQMTEAGTRELIAWMGQPCDASPMKDDLLVKVFAGAIAPPDTLQPEIQRHRQLHEQTLALYRSIQTQFYPNPVALNREALFPYLTLRRGIRYEQDWINWCDEALQLLEDISSAPQ